MIVLVGAALALMKHPDGQLIGKDWALCSLGVYLVSRGVLGVIVVLNHAVLRGLLGADVKAPDDVSWAFSIGLGALTVAMWRQRSHRRARRNARAAVTQTEEREAEDRGHARPVAPAVLSVDDLLLRAEHNIHRRRSALPRNYTSERFEYAAWNCDGALLSHLERVAVLHRAKKDKVAARAELTAALPFLDHTDDASFLARGEDARLGLPSCLDAGPKFNALVFDVWSVALANLARKKGISVTYSSEIIPTADFLPA